MRFPNVISFRHFWSLERSRDKRSYGVDQLRLSRSESVSLVLLTLLSRSTGGALAVSSVAVVVFPLCPHESAMTDVVFMSADILCDTTSSRSRVIYVGLQTSRTACTLGVFRYNYKHRPCLTR